MDLKKRLDIHFSIPLVQLPKQINWRAWLPSRGNVLFTTLLILLSVATQNVLGRNLPSAAVVGPSATTINYQGRLADAGGSPITQNNVPITFTIFDAATAGNPLWSEARVVNVANGLFNVGLGDQTAGGIPTSLWNGDRYLQIMVSSEILTPRELIRSVPVAGMALTVPDGAVTRSKLSADIKIPVIDAGYSFGDYTVQGWGLHLGTGSRTFTAHVTFGKVFTSPPTVIVSLRSFDQNSTKGNSLNVYPQNISVNGFDMLFGVWGDTIAYGASASWVAYGN